jgi:hypothetical protein
VTLADEPIEEAANHNQSSIDAGNRLPSIPMQVIAKVGHISKRDSFHNEKFPVGLAEPSGEFTQVVPDRLPGVRRKVMTSKVACH